MPVNSLKDVGLKFGEWTIIKTLGKGKVLAQCSCGTIREVYKKSLVSGATRSCGCKRNQHFRESALDDLTGKKFGFLTVTRELGGGKVECKCDCGTVKLFHKPLLKSGAITSCGCQSRTTAALTNIQNHSLVGQKFNDLTVIEELGSGMIRCLCSCGNEFVTRKQSVKSGHTKSCGCKTYSFDTRVKSRVGEKFGEWTIIEELENNKVRCRCSCGTERILRKDIVVQGKSKSCGCKSTELSRQTMIEKYGEASIHKVDSPREAWQIETLHDKEKFKEFILNNYTVKPTIKSLSEDLNVGDATIGRKIAEYELEGWISKAVSTSFYEGEVCKYIRELLDDNIKVLERSRSIIPDQELDIYIPDKKLAIEFNGVYWHSSIFKHYKYHQNKTIECAKLGIRLIHIFEHEWAIPDKKEKIKGYLKDILCAESNTKIYGRDTTIREIGYTESKEFVDNNHLQGYINSSINLGCFYKSELVGVMTLGKPRYDKSFEYEIYRMCFKSGTTVIGGANKLFSYFINKYKPSSVVTYADISKFTGNVYSKLGFKSVKITTPGYIWVDGHNYKILSREKTQKHKLVEKNLGKENQTEDEIMYSLGYYKIYDSGNIKLEIVL